MRIDFENIVPWNGAKDTGRDVRLKWERNFQKVLENFLKLANDSDTLLQLLLELDEFCKTKLLRKDQPDETPFLLKLLDGVEIGEFVNSLSVGKGAGIDKQGNAQVESLEVRTYLKVLELIYNRLNALEGDYSFTDFATIEAVELVASDTYKLFLRKRWENDFTALQEHDILFGMVNNLTSNGEYYTSWMRVIQKDAASNFVIVVLYPDEEVPAGKNFPPAKSMNITRRGNALNIAEKHNNRQDSWHLSSNEGAIRFLQGVDKPMLDSDNYAAILGLLPRLDIFKNLNINYDMPYLYARGIIAQNYYEVNYKGQIKRKVVDRGRWEESVALGEEPYRCIDTEVHTTYHLGCKWQCLIDKTPEAPKWNSQSWLFLEGDENYSLNFESTNGYHFYYGRVNTTILACVKYGNSDITDELVGMPGTQIVWQRDTGNVPDDNAWKPTMDEKNMLKLSTSDMGTDWMTRRSTRFICTVYIPVGESYMELQEEIGFNL